MSLWNHECAFVFVTHVVSDVRKENFTVLFMWLMSLAKKVSLWPLIGCVSLAKDGKDPCSLFQSQIFFGLFSEKTWAHCVCFFSPSLCKISEIKWSISDSISFSVDTGWEWEKNGILYYLSDVNDASHKITSAKKIIELKLRIVFS